MLKRILFAAAALLLGLTLIAYLLPSTYRVARSITVKAPPERLFALVNDLHQWPRWTVWSQRDPAMKITFSGALQGKGARQAWESASQGRGEMMITASNPHQSVIYDLYFPDWDSHSIGRVELEPAGDEVRVTWSDEGALGYNPVMRYFGLFFDGMIGPDFEQGLARLKQVAEGTP